jgi:capsular polysaccharide export protein
VHTISSLAGFEALLRERTVTVHGRPFYAGWGLTIDRAQQSERRRRTLELDALVTATLMLYPRYLDPMTDDRIEAEVLLDCFEAGWTDPLIGRPFWHRAAAMAKRWLGPLRNRF